VILGRLVFYVAVFVFAMWLLGGFLRSRKRR
jgi:hypothetical protein